MAFAGETCAASAAVYLCDPNLVCIEMSAVWQTRTTRTKTTRAVAGGSFEHNRARLTRFGRVRTRQVSGCGPNRRSSCERSRCCWCSHRWCPAQVHRSLSAGRSPYRVTGTGRTRKRSRRQRSTSSWCIRAEEEPVLSVDRHERREQLRRSAPEAASVE